MVRFYGNERQYLRDQWKLPDIQHIVNRPETNGRIQDIANVLCPLFTKKFKSPWPGESPTSFAKRKRNMTRAKKLEAKAHPAETQEEFEERMKNLPKIMYTWVSDELHTNPKRQASSSAPVVQIPLVPLPKIRTRRRSALDMYIKEAPRRSGSPTSGRFDVNEYRASCKDTLEDFTPDQLATYEAKAQAFNDKFVRPPNAQDGPAEAPPALPAEAVAYWLDRTIDALYEQLGWGGVFIVGGPGLSGEPVHYIAERGKNRHGLTFLEALRQLGRWTPQEFEGLVGLWLEQSRKTTASSDLAPFVGNAERMLQGMRTASSPRVTGLAGSPSSASGGVVRRANGSPNKSLHGSEPSTPARSRTIASPRATPRGTSASIQDIPYGSFTVVTPEGAPRTPARSPPSPEAVPTAGDVASPAPNVRRKKGKKAKRTTGVQMPVPDPDQETLNGLGHGPEGEKEGVG
ncbi:uncharacterized protein TRAVEDRAFT_43978 [Trametes versicolor FP-101664 SS1]|uniref:uncharacterized protein n=1 Tax=Trametes versicolor (strain FP-101664) TaxID=717944 RepID=UPI0004622AC0|nr:uncharacterized protein TRAVEDRAFT_43978 [Trametes versicolor FP-101664 SS1]EIW61153.1 hypothetical protein TRAVEDRAFT_43978 [Trametes versicolor FP-101664 SS1]